MALEDQLRTDTMGLLRLYDRNDVNSVNPCSYIEGDVKVTGLAKRLNELLVQTCRGRLISVAYGDRRIPQLSFSERLANMIATAAPGPVRDALTNTGFAASWVSTMGANRPYCVHVELKIEGSDYAGTDDVIRFEHCCFQHDFAEGRPSNMNSWSAQVLGRVLINGTVVAQEINTNGN